MRLAHPRVYNITPTSVRTYRSNPTPKPVAILLSRPVPSRPLLFLFPGEGGTLN